MKRRRTIYITFIEEVVYNSTLKALDYIQDNKTGKFILKNSRGDITGKGKLRNEVFEGKWTCLIIKIKPLRVLT